MALPSSGPISWAQIQTEFGGSNPISISEYYGKAAGIPSSGTISASHFHGKSNQVGITGDNSADGSQRRVGTAPLNLVIVSNQTNIQGTGGSGSYTFSWTFISGDSSIACNGTSASLTTFQATCGRNQTRTAVWRCTVTDGSTSAYMDVTVTLTYYYDTGE